MDEDKIEALFREVLKEIGIQENTEVLKNTPKRIAKSYKEISARNIQCELNKVKK